MLYFPDEGHWVLKPQNSQLWNKTVSDWVDQWTKDPELAVSRKRRSHTRRAAVRMTNFYLHYPRMSLLIAAVREKKLNRWMQRRCMSMPWARWEGACAPWRS